MFQRIMLACLTLCLAPCLTGTSLRAEEVPPLQIVTSTTQTADFARQIVGDRWHVSCVLAPGQDPHLYQITPDNAQLVAAADLCIENGLLFGRTRLDAHAGRGQSEDPGHMYGRD